MNLILLISIPGFAFRWSFFNNGIASTLTKYINPDLLLIGAEILAWGIVLTVSTIYLYLFFKKRNHSKIKIFRKDLETLVAKIIMEESSEAMVIPKRFLRKMNNRVARQFAIDELIRLKKSFSGIAGKNIVSLYLQLGLKSFSMKKLQNKNKWHIKARGIQELYQMDQIDVLKTIYRNTNSKTELVRMEAQTGVIHLTGFAGLRFLDIISNPLTEWQQLKLLEQLRLYPEKEDLSEKIPAWLVSKNDTVVVFALKLADEFQQFSVRKHVTNCLVHPIKAVRRQALKTLIRLADERTATILLGYFNKEEFVDQVLILDALKNIASEKETHFLLNLLDHSNDTIKLKAANVLAVCTENGLSVLEKRALIQPEPYERILRHIKTVK